MPNTDALLLLGLGLAALTMFRREQTDTGETDLVNASMMSENTGNTGKALGFIPTVANDNPIGFTPSTAPVSDKDTDLKNIPTGPAPEVNVTEAVQTPVYVRTTGESAGVGVRQLAISTAGVDLINPKIFVQEIAVADPDTPMPQQPLTMGEEVNILAGGANPGDPYYTTLDVLAAARDEGWFDPPKEELPNEAGFIVGASNVFDVAAYNAYQSSIVEPVTQTGGIPTFVEPDVTPEFQGGIGWGSWGVQKSRTQGGGTSYPVDIWGDF